MSNTDVGKKKKLYIAEKPSVAKQFAEALGVNTNSSGRSREHTQVVNT